VVDFTVRFKIVTVYRYGTARSGPHVHGHKRLDDDASESVKPLHVFCVVVTFAASREYITVKGWRG